MTQTHESVFFPFSIVDSFRIFKRKTNHTNAIPTALRSITPSFVQLCGAGHSKKTVLEIVEASEALHKEAFLAGWRVNLLWHKFVVEVVPVSSYVAHTPVQSSI